MSKAFQSLITD